MKHVLKAGPLKLLVVDEDNVERNKSRGEHKRATVGRVIVVDADGLVTGMYTGHTVETSAPVRLAYEQHAWLTRNRAFPIHAAFATEGEVVVTDSDEESEASAAPRTTPKPTRGAAPAVKKEKK